MPIQCWLSSFRFFFQAEDGIRDFHVTGVQTCALPIWIDDLHALDLLGRARVERAQGVAARLERALLEVVAVLGHAVGDQARSEERRVGKARRGQWAQKESRQTPQRST